MGKIGIYIFILAEVIIAGIIVIAFYKNYKLLKSNKYLLEINKWYRMAMTDDLTGVQSHTAYSSHIEKLQSFSRSRMQTGILVFDVDNFKAVNDSKGHLAGDEVLKRVARMLTDVFAGKGYGVYRIGGDEFAVIAECASEREIIGLLIELAEREKAEDVRLSKGYALINCGKSFEKAFAEADKMLYADKAAMKSRREILS